MSHIAITPDDRESLFIRSRVHDFTSYFCERSPRTRRETEGQREFGVFFTSRTKDPTSYFFKWTKEATENALHTAAEFDVYGCKKSVAESWARAQLAGADVVCFDVDSTVCTGEGIDDLAEHCGVGEEVKKWTNAAMGGQMKFEIALAARLDIIRPRMVDFEEASKMTQLTPGVKEFIEALHSRGTHVFLVSGGFRLMIRPILGELQLKEENLYANTIIFDEQGNYVRFDPSEPTSHDGGKAEALTDIIKKGHYKTAVMIGDGVTDLQARPPAKAAIGFGGNVVRKAVQEGADWFVTDFKELTNVITGDLARRMSNASSGRGSFASDD